MSEVDRTQIRGHKSHIYKLPICMWVNSGNLNLLSFICRSRQLLRRHRGHDWLPTKPVDEVELDHNHSRPLHGEGWRAPRCASSEGLTRLYGGQLHRHVSVFQGCFVFSLVKYKPLTYNKVYEYPDWSIGLGWCLALSSMICIPMVMVIKILQSEGPLIEVARRSRRVCAPAALASER